MDKELERLKAIKLFAETFLTRNEIGKARDFKIGNYNLVMTCSECPEQYDVFRGTKQVGYLRLRHGGFRAEYPDCGQEEVYWVETGYGDFECDRDRAIHIIKAVIEIHKRVVKGTSR